MHGCFDSFSSAMTVGDSLDATNISVEADMASVNTGNAMRDGHLHGGEFFDVANHPKLTFTSRGITASGDGYKLAGDLSIKGVSQPISLDVTFNGTAVSPVDKATRFGFSATGSLSRSAYGISYGVPMVSDEVALRLDAQFVAAAEG